MTNTKLNHELDQLAAMFCQLGKATANVVGERSRAISEKQPSHNLVQIQRPGLDDAAEASYRVVGDIETV